MTPSPELTAPPSGGVRGTRLTLPNGLVLVCRENRANPTVAIQGLVKAGAIFDPPGRSGLARFAASMLDRGTKERTALEQATIIEDVGAALHYHGGPETVQFHGNCLSEDLETLLTALADALRNPVFPDDQIEKAREELLTDVAIADDTTSSVASRVVNELLYPEGHPFHLAARGSASSLRAIAHDDLVSFHSARYGPDTTALVLVGDIEPERVAGQVTRAFGDWDPIRSVVPFAVPDAPAVSDVRRRVIQMKGKSQVDVAYGVPGIARTAPDYHAANIANYILGGGSLSSRLMDAVRDKAGLVYGVYSSFSAGIGAGPLLIHAGCNPANADRTASAILEQVRRFRAEGPTDVELADAKAYLTGVFPVRLETNAGVASQLLGAELYGLGMDYIDRYRAIIEGITLDATREAARRHFDADHYAIAIAGAYPADGGTVTA